MFHFPFNCINFRSFSLAFTCLPLSNRNSLSLPVGGTFSTSQNTCQVTCYLWTLFFSYRFTSAFLILYLLAISLFFIKKTNKNNNCRKNLINKNPPLLFFVRGVFNVKSCPAIQNTTQRKNSCRLQFTYFALRKPLTNTYTCTLYNLLQIMLTFFLSLFHVFCV